MRIPICCPASSAWSSSCPASSVLFLISAILMWWYISWYHIVALIAFPRLIIVCFNYLTFSSLIRVSIFSCVLVIWIFSFVMCLFKHFPFFCQVAFYLLGSYTNWNQVLVRNRYWKDLSFFDWKNPFIEKHCTVTFVINEMTIYESKFKTFCSTALFQFLIQFNSFNESCCLIVWVRQLCSYFSCLTIAWS